MAFKLSLACVVQGCRLHFSLLIYFTGHLAVRALCVQHVNMASYRIRGGRISRMNVANYKSSEAGDKVLFVHH